MRCMLLYDIMLEMVHGNRVLDLVLTLPAPNLVDK